MNEMAEKLYEMACDMDALGWDEMADLIIPGLEMALKNLKALAEDPTAAPSWFTLLVALENITGVDA